MATRETEEGNADGDGHDERPARGRHDQAPNAPAEALEPATLPRHGPAWTSAQEAALTAAVRRGDERAMTALYEHYTPILRREAARLGVPASDRGDLVSDTLRGVVLTLVRAGSTVPQSLTGYAIIALRNAHGNGRRQAQRIAALERAIRQELLSQSPVEDPVDVADDPAATRPLDTPDVACEPEPVQTRYSRVLAALTAALGARLSTEEWQLLAWLADYVPQRDMARWLGISHGAVRVRVHRLRERLREVAQSFGSTLPLLEQRELERFFRRAGVSLPSTPTRRASRGRSASDAETS